ASRSHSLDLASVKRPQQQYHTIDPANIPQWMKNNEDLIQTYHNKEQPQPQPQQPQQPAQGGGLISNAFSSLLGRNNNNNNNAVAKPAAANNEYLNRSKESSYPDVESKNFLYKAGKDHLGRSVVVIIASNLPVKTMDMERVLLYTISVMDPVVDGDYVLIYLHTNITNDNKPDFAWLKKVYAIFNRKYKKNLKGLYIVHPTTWIKFTLRLFKPFISEKFWKKLTYIEDLADLFKSFGKDQLNLPHHIMMHKPAGRKAQPIFGVPLEQVVNRPDNNSDIPVLFVKGFEYLETRALHVEGIFRLSGANSQIKSMKQCFDSGEDINLNDCEDVHTVAGLLKLYLRELPEPLFPFDTYPSFIEIAKSDMPREEKIESLKLLISLLPPANRALTRQLFHFLDKVLQNAHINKMTAVNLSIVFAPNLLKTQDTNVMAVVADAQHVILVVQYLLENISTIW
ncbi:hypothetical protein SAMD00019534_006320, partial [Acytostelium subglobosum LB1]|uniref:hypothetical protein n=1 Tax=Acytostelium subglobosum LB1 TaxID=1410327 RepID=UPI000644F09A